jgi:phosphatidylethanolamine-binding protein (PEBP) family uncharacterized protein
MKLISSAFKHNGFIPSIFTCEGENINPPLEILDAPIGTKSFVLIVDDPDVPKYIKKDGIYPKDARKLGPSGLR